MTDQSTDRTVSERQRIDPFALLAGLATLLVAGYVLSDGPSWLGTVDFRWVLAGGAALTGTLMLIASMRGGRND